MNITCFQHRAGHSVSTHITYCIITCEGARGRVHVGGLGLAPEPPFLCSLLLSPSLSSVLSDRQAGPVASWQACPGSCSHKARPLSFGELIRLHSSSRAPAGLHTAPFRAAEGSWLRSLAGEVRPTLLPLRGAGRALLSWKYWLAVEGTAISQKPEASFHPGSPLLAAFTGSPSLKFKFLASDAVPNLVPAHQAGCLSLILP